MKFFPVCSCKLRGGEGIRACNVQYGGGGGGGPIPEICMVILLIL